MPRASVKLLVAVVEDLAREAAGEPHGDDPFREIGTIRKVLARLEQSFSSWLESARRPAEMKTDTLRTELFAALGALAARIPEGQRGRWLTALQDLDRHCREDGWTGTASTKDLLRVVRFAIDERLLPADAMRRHMVALEAWLPKLRGASEMSELGRRLHATRAEAEPDEAVERLEVALEPSGFSDAEAAYVGNAGLVILWPFLGHFFEHLGLMTDKAFHDDDARHRAVGLLQYVATEDPSPPEFLLTLDKVLCGMDVYEVFEFGPPVTEAEAEECANLLAAVIGHAPILGDMSHEGFRGTFLVRKGAFSAEGGSWLLRVERETYDVVLDRFPWSVSWVKLPWMEAPLRVEW